MAKRTSDIVNDLLAFEEPVAYTKADLLSSGSTLVNLAVTGDATGCFIKGTYTLLIGASGAGKTWLGLTCFAEALRNDEFLNYRLIFDNAEHGALMDIEKFFGAKVRERCEPPCVRNGEPVYSTLITEFGFSIFDAIDAAKKPNGRPFIYVLDSLDSLSSKEEREKFDKKRKKRFATKKEQDEIAADYGDGKAKWLSRNLRAVCHGLRETKSILIIINQERDKIDAGHFESKDTHAGGRALKFYAATQMWAKLGSSIKRQVRGQKLAVGINARVRCPKNRADGKDRTVAFPIYYDYGMDDIGSCIDWLLLFKCWKKTPNSSEFDTGLDFDGKYSKTRDLISHIEENDLEGELRMVMQREWAKVEKELEDPRKKRYD